MMREAGMTGQGLILVAFLAVLVTLLVTKGRRRMGLGVNNRTYGLTFVVCAVIVLGFWALGHN
jgi:high-affinity Fe2+/Pb2+ permease